MSTSDQDRAKRVRRRINPATASVEELLNHLATDPASGLSPQEAERRLAASTAKPLYRAPARRYTDCLKRVIREPALWLLLAVAVISLFFDRVLLGLVCLLLAGGNAALSAFFLWRSDRTDTALAAYDAPLCRVLRGRRIYRAGASELVRGDILVFYGGDMIPADCRLLRTEDFTVTEREISTDPDRPSVKLRKDASATPESAGSYRLSPENMVFAGGVCESGFAIAVVVAVGSETHLGGLTGGLDSPRAGRMPSLFKKAAGYLSIYNLGLIVLIVPVTAVGIFTLGERYELLDIFLATLALAGVTLTEHILARGLHVNAAVRRAAATDRDAVNTADIKSAAIPERLTRVTDLILVGSAALHDGGDHAETIRMGDRLYHCDRPEADDEVRTAAEYLYLYRHGILAYPSEGQEQEGSASTDTLVSLADAVSEWAEIDTDALLVRAKDPRAEADGISAVFPTAEGNRRVTVRVTADFGDVRDCDACYANGLVQPMTEIAQNDLYRAYREAVRTGRRTLFLITRAGSETAVRAMLTYAPHTCRKTAGAIKSMENAGIRVASFLRDHGDVSLRAQAECGLTETAPVSRPAEGDPAARTPAADLMDSGVRAFADCDTDYVLDAIRDLKAQGRTIAVLSSDREDIHILGAADVAVTCSPSLYASAESGHPRLPANATSPRDPLASPDGAPDGVLASDLCRRRADVVVRRTASDGGGAVGFRRALLCADHIKNTTARVFRFLLLSQAARLVLAVLPLVLGLSTLTAPALLLSGLCIDLLVLVASIALPLPPSPAPRESMDAVIARPHMTHRNSLIAVAAATSVPTLIAAVCRFCNVGFGGDPTHYLFLCLVGLQLAIYRADPLPKRDRTVFFTTLALVLTYVAALAVALGAGLGLLWTLVLPLTAPAVYLAVKLILDRVMKVRSPASGKE